MPNSSRYWRLTSPEPHGAPSRPATWRYVKADTAQDTFDLWYGFGVDAPLILAWVTPTVWPGVREVDDQRLVVQR